MSLKEELTSLCAGIILSQVKVRGRQTFISEDSGINRKYFNRRQFRLLRFHRLVRLLYCVSGWTSRKEFGELGRHLFECIWDKNEDQNRSAENR